FSRDWSSDVCSSDLENHHGTRRYQPLATAHHPRHHRSHLRHQEAAQHWLGPWRRGQGLQGFDEGRRVRGTSAHREERRQRAEVMFDVGFSELVLLALLALIIAGPERLPAIMRTLGRLAGRAKATVAALRTELEREVDQAGEEKPTANRQDDDKP